ncbi:MAG: ATP-binding protein [Tenuifilaceae bacterium]|nr:ATP-binding protein [Tenuifilaceae bacterium]
MKKRHLKTFALATFLLSAILFAIIPYSTQISTRKLATLPQINRAQEVLVKRTNTGMQATKDLINEAYDYGFESAFDLLSNSKWDELQKNGLAIFLYEDNELQFWSESMDVNLVQEFSNKLIKVQNTWCLSYWIARDNIKGLLLVKVRYSYPYQNKFLKNSYHESLNFLKNYSLSPTSLNGSFPVSLFGPNPIFYLSYIPKDFEFELENFKSILTHAGFLLLIISLYILLWLSLKYKRKAVTIPLLLLLIISLRLALLYWIIITQGNLKLFSYEIFAYSWYSPSLGDLLINTLIIFALLCFTQRTVAKVTPSSKVKAIVWGGALALVSFIFFFYSSYLTSVLVHNSTITLEAYRIFNLSVYALVEYLIISLWFTAGVLALFSSAKLLKPYGLKPAFITLVSAFVLAVTVQFTYTTPTVLSLLFAMSIPLIILKPLIKTGKLNANQFITLILLFSIFTVYSISDNSDKKDKEVRKILAINLANERDPVAEVIFPQIYRKMHTDEEIIRLLGDILAHESDLYNYLDENYLNSYLKKFDFQITVCLSTSDIRLGSSGEVYRCFDFFEDMLNDYGTRIPGTSFYYLDNQNGRISYLGMIEYVLPDGQEICIYLELDSKLSREILGYPELLLDGNTPNRSILSDYSSAKYFKGNLIARTGEFNYPLSNEFQPDTVSNYTFVDFDSYNHLIYTNDSEIELYLSRPKEKLFNITASFAWVFLFFFMVGILWLTLGGVPIGFNFGAPSLKSRIKFSMVQLIVLSLIMVGLVTIVYSVKSFEKKNYDSLNEKLQSAKVDIEDNLVTEDIINPEYANYLTHYLIKLSNVLRSDINIYGVGGELIATSRPEIIDRQLIGTTMHPLPLHDLSKRHIPKLINTENIGEMEFLSAYAPLFNTQNQKIAYLNLPYFTRQGEFMQEIFSVVVALVNIYTLLILFTIFVAVLISNQITKPIELLREKLSTIDFDKHNETLNYIRNDELGQLVTEYNRMVVELAESANKLAQSQRQSAWREMAKQIAHEIKNPLTPIKLNLQYLIRAKKTNQPGWDELFEKFADTLIEQIGTLSNIATEFSNFAKMPIGQFNHIAINGIVRDASTLFSKYPNIEVENDIPEDDIMVYADKEQLSRVFVNIIKNATQAIGRKPNGHIKVSLFQSGEYVKVVVEDNGSGISDDASKKIFTPNFTTKSGGMGLGLAISKEIVKLIGGEIWFETTLAHGTKFYVQLPVSTASQND